MWGLHSALSGAVSGHPRLLMPLYEADLSPELLVQLFADYAQLPGRCGVQARGPRGLVRVGLEVACPAFLAGELSAIQVQYVHDGREWRDTVMRVGAGARLVRMELGDPPTVEA